MTAILVIGAGPAGLAAATWLAQAGAGPVTVVERQAEPGGVPRLCGHSPFGMREFHRILGGAAYASRLADAAIRAGATLLLNHAVTAIAADLTTDLASPVGIRTLTPDRILLATGAREASRAERLLPGDRPLGVLTTGALQDLWFARGALPFRRPVILGTELVALSALLTCRQAGARPVAMVEPGPARLTRAPLRWFPDLLRLPVYTAATITDLIAKDGRLAQVTIRTADGGAMAIDTDGLVLTGNFRPETGLARLCGLQIDPATQGPVVDQSGRTSHPGIYAAGNILRGIETAGACWAEGRAVARALMADLGQTPAPAVTITPGNGLRYVMPQRFTPGAATALPRLQLRLAHAATGTLSLCDGNGSPMLSRSLTSTPQRRVTLPLPTGTQGPLSVELKPR